jgi:hypothetical protein
MDARHRVPGPEHVLVGLIGLVDVEPAVDQDGRIRAERLQDVDQRGRHHHGHVGRLHRRGLSQLVQVLTAGLVQP